MASAGFLCLAAALAICAPAFTNGFFLQGKMTAALAGGKYPDVVYIFGPNVANLARSPKALDLTKLPGFCLFAARFPLVDRLLNSSARSYPDQRQRVQSRLAATPW